MEQIYRSVAGCFPEPIDCRLVQIELEFYDLPRSKTIEFCETVITWNEQMTGEGFVKRRHLKNRCVSLERLLKSLHELQSNTGWSYWQDAYVISHVVNNAKSISQFERNVKIAQSLGMTPLLSCSLDYPLFWGSLFPNGKEAAESIRQKVIRIFQEENKVDTGSHLQTDVSAFISIAPYSVCPDLYHGSASFCFSAYSLGGQIQRVADQMCVFLTALASQFVNLNGRVKLAPMGDSYRRYFGHRERTDGSHIQQGLQPVEWYKTYYVPSVEWFNVLSPLAQVHFTDHPREVEDVYTERISGGGWLVCVRKPIDQYGLRDARKIKELLLPALYPASSAFQLSMLFPQTEDQRFFSYHLNPRRYWGIIPVFPDEIEIVSNYLVFKQRATE